MKGAIAPTNTPAGSAVKAAQPVPATNYQLMLAHIVGGSYRSPTLGQQGSLGSPPAQKDCNYTPYLLASPAGVHTLANSGQHRLHHHIDCVHRHTVACAACKIKAWPSASMHVPALCHYSKSF